MVGAVTHIKRLRGRKSYQDDPNVDERQKDMLNDEFDPMDMNNPDDEIGIGENEGLDLESNILPTPIVGNNIHALLNHHA